MSVAGVLAFFRILWGMRFIIALCGAFVLGCWVVGWWSKTQDLKRERDDLIATNQATMEAMDKLAAEKAKNEAILTDRAARKSKEADQLSAIVKKVLSHDASTDCPVSPAVDDALDGLL
jgi:hypothetical protein